MYAHECRCPDNHGRSDGEAEKAWSNRANLTRRQPSLPGESSWPSSRPGWQTARMTAQSAFLIVGVLSGVLALIVAATRLFQLGLWRAGPRPGRKLVLCESIALDPRRRIHLVQCGQRQVVLLTGGGQDLVIGWLQEP